MTDARRTSYVIHWETTAVTTLPLGWRNVFRLEDGALQTSPCPAILLQENRGRTKSWDEPADGTAERRTKYTAAEPPYETRAVFADYDVTGGELEAANDLSNYVGTVGPGQELAELQETP
jgi:hypothetical protein